MLRGGSCTRRHSDLGAAVKSADQKYQCAPETDNSCTDCVGDSICAPSERGAGVQTTMAVALESTCDRGDILGLRRSCNDCGVGSKSKKQRRRSSRSLLASLLLPPFSLLPPSLSSSLLPTLPPPSRSQAGMVSQGCIIAADFRLPRPQTGRRLPALEKSMSGWLRGQKSCVSVRTGWHQQVDDIVPL